MIKYEKPQIFKLGDQDTTQGAHCEGGSLASGRCHTGSTNTSGHCDTNGSSATGQCDANGTVANNCNSNGGTP
jgi:hypothetical protein